jgi:hypothetical protein
VAHRDVEATEPDLEPAEGLLEVELLEDHLAALLDLVLELAELLVLDLLGAAGAAVLELDLGLELEPAGHEALERGDEAGRVELEAAILGRTARAVRIRAVVVEGEPELAVAAELEGERVRPHAVGARRARRGEGGDAGQQEDGGAHRVEIDIHVQPRVNRGGEAPARAEGRGRRRVP